MTMKLKLNIGGNPYGYSGLGGFLAQLIVMTLAVIVASYLLPGVHVNSIQTAILTAISLALLNTFIRPILIVLTLPFTIFSLGFFLLIINALIIMLAAKMVNNFTVDSFGSAFWFSLMITIINYLLELPNKKMRKPDYDSQGSTDYQSTEEDFTPYEEVVDDTEEENNQ